MYFSLWQIFLYIHQGQQNIINVIIRLENKINICQQIYSLYDIK